MYYPMYFDPTYILIIIGVLLSLAASTKVKSTFSRYSGVRSLSGLTGAQTAERILHQAGIYDVGIARISGDLTDHYDPSSKTLRLSDSVYGSNSVAAVSVAAHECGHAIQHQENYAPLKIRAALVPVANFGAGISWPLIIIGLFIQSSSAMLFIHLGIIAFSASVLFQLVTLPVEFNASRRAVKILESTGMLNEEEVSGTKKVLKAAALTYVAGAAASILQLLRLIAIGGRRRGE